MKISQILSVLLPLSLWASVGFTEDSLSDLDAEQFQVKVKPNSIIPSVKVYSDDHSKIKYTKSRSEILYYDVEVRGRCKFPRKLKSFKLLNGVNQTVLDIPVSGKNRNLTGNRGKKWATYKIRAGFRENLEPNIKACNDTANSLLLSLSHDEVLNSNFTTHQVYAGQLVKVEYVCATPSFSYPTSVQDSAILPSKALCEATGYQSLLEVTESSLSTTPITGQDGTCKLNISGEFRTNYALYSDRSQNQTTDLRYRFKYQNSSTNSYSQWWQKTTNPINGGAFLFNYTDRLPSTIRGGKVSLEVDINDEVYSGQAMPFSIDCVDALPLQQTQNLVIDLAVTADLADTVPINGQLCPTHVNLSGELLAGYPINGKMIIYGTTLVDIHVNPIALSANQSETLNKRVKINWPNSSNTLSVVGGTTSTALRKQTLNYGMKVTNSNNEVVEALDKKPFIISCQYPSVNPSLNGSNTLNMSPDHTGGGGAPTDLTGLSPFSLDNDKNKTVDTGLRSDGELVQATKGKSLLNHELTHIKAQQEGKNIARHLDLATPKHKNTDAHDRLANQQTSQQKIPLPLKNTTFANRQAEQLKNMSNKKSTLYKGKAGDACTANRFPKNTVIIQAGKQRVVECIKGKATINSIKKINHPWQVGDPVFSTPTKKTGPKKEIRQDDLGDVMPEDFPEG